MRSIDEPRLESDLPYRFHYLAEFMGFSPDDVAALHAASPLLMPAIDDLVDAVYVKLFSYDATKRHFVPRQHGYEGKVPQSIETLSLDHDQIRFRKTHLANYLKLLVSLPYDDRMVKYLDHVGKIHTREVGSVELHVPLVQMNALMGFVTDAIIATILGFGLERSQEQRAVRAFSKLLWLQNDLITRHYARH